MSKKEIISNIVWFGGLIVVLLCLRAFVFSPTNVSGNSMNPTMVDRERVIAMKQSKVQRFDIITFPAPDNPSKNYIKRVIGLPGDTIEFKDDQLLINGKKYDEPYLNEYKENPSDVKTPYGLPLTQDFKMEDVAGEKKVPAGHYFVMGDNRQNSKDSRMIGFINEDDILGNVKFAFWPPAKWGSVK
ncbi:signal peptidase I [Vagococcus hydrophili]|uniref:Signal peptidase I n=1 Tax=Vagococcus hydrophili TaxID=2714947 RepID=A0A6G8AVL3_9ENTE|nr:signal peptidase I [Vagococcus hydrophili]QIL48953.1 signal peptidase I [Vagococcus hydrophili]